MAVEARMNPTWRNKWLLLAGFLMFFAVWSVYDALVAYPAHNQRVAKFQEFDDTGRLSEWPDYAKSQGWSDEDPGEPMSEGSIQTQWVQMGICIALAALVLGRVFQVSRTKLAAEDDALVGPSGQRVGYDQITEIDKTRWDSKGIAVVHYGADGGKRKLKLDDWVYRDADQVLAQVEKRTGLGTPV